jgi:UPF0755 protein
LTSQRLVAAVLGAAVVAGVVALAWFVYGTPGAASDALSGDARTGAFAPEGEPRLIEIEPGESAQAIGARLEDEGIIRSGRLFEVLVSLTGVGGALEAGVYEFEPGTPAVEAVDRIASGRTASRQVLFPEGLRMEEMAEILERNGVTTAAAFTAALNKAEYDFPFLDEVPSDSLQGYLFPASYEFVRDPGAPLVVETMLLGFQDNVADSLQLEGQALTLAEVVTLASIVEREAATPEERPIIASVFLNRLRLDIPLQADPTVQYALTADPANVAAHGWWKEALTFDDLRFDSPYNTYVYAGLPPGPIANPGLASMEAVVAPAQTDYLFFVARDDGTHVFAETLEEHLMNVERYQPPG